MKYWARLKLGNVSTEKRFVTAAAVAHLRLHDGDETGEASKVKQIAKTASINLLMLGAGGMTNCVIRAATCQVEKKSILNAGFDELNCTSEELPVCFEKKTFFLKRKTVLVGIVLLYSVCSFGVRFDLFQARRTPVRVRFALFLRPGSHLPLSSH
jgi:hypothetical protein